MKKATFMMFFFIMIVLFCSFATINDETRFQIELQIQHQFSRILTINQFSENTPISGQDGSKSVSVNPINGTDSFEVCKIDYSTNVYGRNLIYLNASPLFLLDNQGNATNETMGYTLDFDYQADGWTYSLEVTRSSSNDMIIPITVPFVFEDGVIQTLSA